MRTLTIIQGGRLEVVFCVMENRFCKLLREKVQIKTVREFQVQVSNTGTQVPQTERMLKVQMLPYL